MISIYKKPVGSAELVHENDSALRRLVKLCRTLKYAR